MESIDLHTAEQLRMYFICYRLAKGKQILNYITFADGPVKDISI